MSPTVKFFVTKLISWWYGFCGWDYKIVAA